MPQLDKLRSLSTTGDCTYSQFYLTILYLYQAFLTDRAITDGNIELQGNECLKEIKKFYVLDCNFNSLFNTGDGPLLLSDSIFLLSFLSLRLFVFYPDHKEIVVHFTQDIYREITVNI